MKLEYCVCVHLIKHLFFILWFSFCVLEPTIISRLQTLLQALEKLIDPGPWAHRAWRIDNPVGEIFWEVPGSVGPDWLLCPNSLLLPTHGHLVVVVRAAS